MRSLFTSAAILLMTVLPACSRASLPAPNQTISPAVSARTPAYLPALPDLAVAYVKIAMRGLPVDTTECVKAYAPYELRAKVENRGNARATDIQVFESSTGTTIQIDALPAGESVEVIIPAGSPTGAYHISVDSQDLIPETNESNNTAEFLANTPTPPILCRPTPPAETPIPSSTSAIP